MVLWNCFRLASYSDSLPLLDGTNRTLTLLIAGSSLPYLVKHGASVIATPSREWRAMSQPDVILRSLALTTCTSATQALGFRWGINDTNISSTYSIQYCTTSISRLQTSRSTISPYSPIPFNKLSRPDFTMKSKNIVICTAFCWTFSGGMRSDWLI